ncbi:hypothetical protein [Maribacter sp. 2210JD10-5]|uniref:hypothetical protein n=1 Tax=Maribacter sp. 2210JD10-5 TaxID=3386272 RepID=UPI0039BC7AAB
MAYEKYSTRQLQKYKKVLLVLGIVGLVIMCVMLGAGLYQTAHGSNNNFIIYLVPILGPLVVLPSIFSSNIEKEIKKRAQQNS